MRKVILLLVAVGCLGYANAQTVEKITGRYFGKDYKLDGDTIYHGENLIIKVSLTLFVDFKNGSKQLKAGDTVIIAGSLTSESFSYPFILTSDLEPNDVCTFISPTTNLSNNTHQISITPMIHRGTVDAKCIRTTADGAVSDPGKSGVFYLVRNGESVSEASLAKVKVFPTLASDEIQVINLNNSNVAIYSLVGQEMIAQSNLTGNVSIDVSSLANGIYFVKIQNGSAVRTEKIKIFR